MLSRLPLFLLFLACSLAGACQSPSSTVPTDTRHRLRILGTAQDGGLPHLGCERPTCVAARRDPSLRARVAALGVISASGNWWLIDATPDLPDQIHDVGELPRGVFLTHAHIGHYTGLMYFGREVAATREMPIHCSRAMGSFLQENAPWDQLLHLNQIVLRGFEGDRAVELEAGLQIVPWEVPHRNEYADTHGYLIEVEGGRRALYLPDIDRWEEWDRDLRVLAEELDYLIVDGSFFSGDELPGRDMSEIPHPTVRHTMQLLQEVVDRSDCRVIFTHHNHTNPLWDPNSEARRELARRGFETALEVSELPL